MSNNTEIKSVPTRRNWLKKLAIVLGGLVVLLVVAFFVVTSSGFIKGVILPRVGQAMNATLTADEVTLSPFSQLHLRGVKLQTTGTEPLLTVAELRARYSLMAMLGGTLQVDEVLIDSPVVNVIETADGKRNTDALTEGSSEATPARPPTSQPPAVDLKSFNLKNATVRYTKHHPGGTRDFIELTGLNVTLADIKNGAAGKFSFALEAKAELNPPELSQRGAVTLKHDGDYTFTLGPDLLPTQISGSDQLEVTSASGAFAELAGAGLDFTAEMTPTELKGVTVSFRKAGVPMGVVRLAGPFDALKREGQLTLTIAGIDRRLLNLAGAAAGIDFGNTAISSTNVITITQGGNAVSVTGRLGVTELQLKQAGQLTPRLELGADYQLSVDVTKSLARLQSLNLVGQQDGRALLRSELSAPMTFGWGETAAGAGDSTLTLKLTALNLADWRAFVGDAVAGGTVDASVKIVSQEAGKKLGVELNSALQNITTAPGAAAYSAKVELKTVMVQQANLVTVGGTLGIADLISRQGTSELRLPLTQVEFDLKQAGDVIELPKLLVRLAATERAKNELLLTGRVDMTKPEAITGNLKLAAETLDLSQYYDLVMGMTNAPVSPASASAPVDSQREPDAMTLPCRNFVCDLSIGRLYLHEVDIQNWQTTLVLDGGRVTVKPVQLMLNGAPVTGSADVDLSVPGFKYAVDFKAPNVPLAPLVNSFQPARKGQLGGTVSAAVQLQGAGVTGASLQQNLVGQFDFVATNLNLSLSDAQTQVVKSLVNVITRIPDIVRNPSSAVGSLLGGLLGAKREAGGSVDEFMKKPVNVIAAQGTAGGGKIELKRALLESTAFRAEATGVIDIATVLSNSVMRFPVSVSLGRSVADKLGLTPPNTPTNAVFVALPEFLKLKGTLGMPEAKPDWAVIAQLALKSSGSLWGGTSGTNATGGTNLTQTNNATSELIRGLGGLLGGSKKKMTNQPAPSP